MTSGAAVSRRLIVAGLLGLPVYAAQAQTLTPITIAMSSGSMPAAVPRIAKELGLFEKHGLDAKVTIMDNASVATMALLSGSADLVSNATTDAIVARSRGQDVVALASVYRGFAAVVVISKEAAQKSGISPDAPLAQRFKALDGLLLATPSATSTYTFSVRKAAEEVGAKVNVTFMAQPAMVAALETGAIQGYVASAPFYAVSALSGKGVVWISGPRGDFPDHLRPQNAQTLNAKRDFAVRQPEAVRRLRAVMADFGTVVERQPELVKAALSKLYPDVTPETLNVLFANELPGFKTQPLTVDDMAKEIAYLKASSPGLAGLDAVTPESLLLP